MVVQQTLAEIAVATQKLALEFTKLASPLFPDGQNRRQKSTSTYFQIVRPP